MTQIREQKTAFWAPVSAATIFLSLLFSSTSVAENEHKTGQHATAVFGNCLDEIGEYLFATDSTKKTAIASCPSAAFSASRNAERWMTELNGARDRNLQFEESERKACLAKWSEDWNTAINRATGHAATSDNFNRVIEPIPAELTEFEADVFFRSRVEQSMTLLAEERMADYTPNQQTCNNVWLNIGAARQENVAFFIQHRVFEKLLSGELSSSTHRRIWLVVQHADLFPHFQAEGLKTFQAATNKVGFPEVLRNALEERIESNLKEQWYRDIAAKYQ